jgi:hypothetical protein
MVESIEWPQRGCRAISEKQANERDGMIAITFR